MSTIKKALQVLQVFLDNKSQFSVSEMAIYSGLSTNAVYRIASLLREEGYLSQQNKRGKYVPGPKFLEFGNLARDMLNIEDLSRPYMSKLNNLTDETVQLAILDGEKAIHIANFPGKQKLRIVTEVNADLPLYCTGVGKIFLAYMSEVELERYFSKMSKLHIYTPNTITDQDVLVGHLSRVRKDGIGIEREEYTPGIVDIAAPIKNGIGRVVAALGVLIPEPRATDQRVAELVPLIKNAATEISKALGYSER